MSRFDLSKKVEAARFVLTKRKIENIPSQVAFGLDISGSMRGLYNNGTVQNVVERILGISINVDENKEVDIWTFDNNSQKIKTVKEDNVENYVTNEILNNSSVRKWGGTNYAPVMDEIIKEFFGNKILSFFSSKKKIPVTALIITDGENEWNDRQNTIKLIESNFNKNIYWNFIGIGGSNFPFLEKLASEYDNVGFASVNDIESISDSGLYEIIINEEYANWIKDFR